MEDKELKKVIPTKRLAPYVLPFLLSYSSATEKIKVLWIQEWESLKGAKNGTHKSANVMKKRAKEIKRETVKSIKIKRGELANKPVSVTDLPVSRKMEDVTVWSLVNLLMPQVPQEVSWDGENERRLMKACLSGDLNEVKNVLSLTGEKRVR